MSIGSKLPPDHLKNDILTGGGGADVFTLGGLESAHYIGIGYAIITDFSWLEGDSFLVFGSIGDYSLDKSQNFSGGTLLDTLVYYQNDLIGVVEDTTSVSLFLDFSYS